MAFWSNKDASPARKYRFKMGPAGTNWWYVNSVTLPSFEINTGEYQLLNQKFKYPGVPTWNPVTISIIDTADSVDKVKKFLVSKDFDFLQMDGLEKKMTNATREALRKTKKEQLDQAQERRANAIKEEANIRLSRDTSPAVTRGIERRRDEALAANEAAVKKASKAVSPSDDLDIIIEQMGADGKTFRTWTLVNSFITSVNYGDLDYSSDDLVSIEISVAYDYATTEK